MKNHSAMKLWLAVILIIQTGCSTAGDPRTKTTESETLTDFVDRVAIARTNLKGIVTAAEAAAQRKLDHPEALINVNYALQASFADELLNRSGGLAGALPSIERPGLVTDHDIVVFSLRSWEANGQKAVEYLKDCREKGWMTILFASAAGKPDNLEVDFFIDNGAPDGSTEHAPVNLIANCLNGWLWVCEYTSAMTRLGRHPGILYTITAPGSQKHNRAIQSHRTRHHNYPCDFPVPAEDLSLVYLARVEHMISDLAGAETQAQIAQAADIIAARLNAGRKVYASTNTHIMVMEIGKNDRTPWQPIMAIHRPMKDLAELQPGDLLFWVGFNGLSIWAYEDGPCVMYRDYDAAIRQTGADFITSFSTDPLHPENNAHGALAHVEQKWMFGDAVVPIPFPPSRMAPISGLYQAMIYRMVDEAAANRLK